MKLWEAIKLGAMLGKQCFGKLHWRRGDDRRSCAMGAAQDAAGVDFEGLESVFPVLGIRAIHFSLPCGCDALRRDPRGGRPTFEHIIYHLNDDHNWTREQIADYVKAIEDAQPLAESTSVAEGNAPQSQEVHA